MNFHWGIDQNQTLGMTCVKLRYKYYKQHAHILQNLWKGCGKLPAALHTVVSVFTISCPDCVLISLLPYPLNELLLTFTTQLKYLLIQDNFYNPHDHPGRRKHLLSGLPQHSLQAPFIPSPPITNHTHRQVGIKSVPTSQGCCES